MSSWKRSIQNLSKQKRARLDIWRSADPSVLSMTTPLTWLHYYRFLPPNGDFTPFLNANYYGKWFTFACYLRTGSHYWPFKVKLHGNSP